MQGLRDQALHVQWNQVTIHMPDTTTKKLALVVYASIMKLVMEVCIYLMWIWGFAYFLFSWSMSYFFWSIFLYVLLMSYQYIFYAYGKELVLKYSDKMEYRPVKWYTPWVFWQEKRIHCFLLFDFDLETYVFPLQPRMDVETGHHHGR